MSDRVANGRILRYGTSRGPFGSDHFAQFLIASSVCMISHLLLVSLIWGITNPFIKNGSECLIALRADQYYRESSTLVKKLREAHALVTNYRYIVPLCINLSGSALFYHTLGNSSEIQKLSLRFSTI